MPRPRTAISQPSAAAEDYLERILALVQTKRYARGADIAAELGISRASVTAMVQKLGASGHVRYERYRGLSLTVEGEEVARRIARRHELLTDFLTALELPAEVIGRDVEGLEHHLSDETCAALARVTAALRRGSLR